MITLLARLFIKDYTDYSRPTVRRAYGTLCAMVAIMLNIILAVAKWCIANMSGAFAIRADAVNNLTDAGSSALLLLAFYFAGMKPRPDRPFGHGRIEYVAGLLVGGVIIFTGVELARHSFARIIAPEPLVFSAVTLTVLIISIAVKCYMGWFMVGISKKINSEALRVTGIDSLSDTIATFAALLALVLYAFTPTHWNLDGVLGMLVSVLILKAGADAAWGTLKQLLGTTPDPEVVRRVKDICMGYDEVIGIHDIVVHDYGPGRLHISVHCEVRGDGDIYQLHETMDQIMDDLDAQLGCQSVIHMDPVCTDDAHLSAMLGELKTAVMEWNDKVQIHDFRIVKGPTQCKVIFDCVVPFDVEGDTGQAMEKVQNIVRALWKNSVPVVKIDRPYI